MAVPKTGPGGIGDLVARLNGHLGATAVAALADVRDSQVPHRWAQADGPHPEQASVERLELADELWEAIAASEGDAVARSWFLGANPPLGEASPVLEIRAGRFSAVRDAARATLDGSWQG